MAESSDDRPRLFASLRRVAAATVELGRSRLDLAAVEWEEERLRLVDLLVRAATAAVLGLLTLMSATALVVVWLWEYSPVGVLVGVTLLYAGGTAWTVQRLRKALRNHPQPFSDTRAALQADAHWLKGGDSP